MTTLTRTSYSLAPEVSWRWMAPRQNPRRQEGCCATVTSCSLRSEYSSHHSDICELALEVYVELDKQRTLRGVWLPACQGILEFSITHVAPVPSQVPVWWGYSTRLVCLREELSKQKAGQQVVTGPGSQGRQPGSVTYRWYNIGLGPFPSPTSVFWSIQWQQTELPNKALNGVNIRKAKCLA